jgi:hypothetical protein
VSLPNASWPTQPKDSVHGALTAVFSTVREESEWRVEADELHLGFYKQSERHVVRGGSMRGAEYEQATLPHNVCRGAVDTLQAKIAKRRPLPVAHTSAGNWGQQKRARKMSQFLEGEFYRQRIYEKHAPMIVRDALIFGRGHLTVFVRGRRIGVERLFPWEVFDDEWDARYGEPRNRFYLRSFDQGVALETFARTEAGGWTQEIKRAIEEAGLFNANAGEDYATSTVKRIHVVDAYHLCDDPDAHVIEAEEEAMRASHAEDDDDDRDAGSGESRGRGAMPKKHKCNGRHVVFTTAGVLLDEPWTFPYFPDVQLNFNEPVAGSKGTGLIEQIEGYQFAINDTCEVSAEQYRLSGVHILLPDTAKISFQDFRNGINLTGYSGIGKPEIFHADLVNEHMRARPRELRADALNDAGLSEMSVQSEKPAGITAAIALQTLDDKETERFFIPDTAFSTWNLEIGRRFVDCAKLIAETHGEYAVSVPMKRGLLPLKWTDVYVDGAELKLSPTSFLPTEPAAKKQALNDMWESQQIDRAVFLRLLDDPDLQAELDLETADKLVIDEMLERMRDAEEDEGEDAFMPPSEYQQIWTEDENTGRKKPGWAPRRAQQTYNRALLDGAPEFNLDLLRRFMKACDDIIKKANAEQMAPVDPAMATPANVNGVPDMAAQPMPAGAMPAAPPMAA